MALAIEDPAGLDDQALRVNLARGDTLVVNFHAALGIDHTVEAAGDHYVVAFDLALHACLIPQNQCLRRDQQALNFALDPKGPGAFECALKTHGFVEKTRPLGRGVGGISLSELPGQKAPRR